MSGVPVDGQIYPPSGNAAPMDARCSITISSEGTFLVAQALVLIPPGLTGVQIYEPYETLWPIGDPFAVLAKPAPFEAIAWEFVVTRERAIPVDSATIAGTKTSTQAAPYFHWNGTSWHEDDANTCGGGLIAGGGRWPEVEFISACPA
jgi:hypothetical protein